MTIERFLRIIPLRLRSVFHRSDVERELDEELEYHIEQQTAQNIRAGMTPQVARTAALRAIGGIEFRKEQVRDTRGTRWLEEAARDLRFAVRSLRHSPAFTAVVVLTLALGIGANTAIFSVVRGVLLKPLPHRDGDRLVYLRHSMDGPGGANLNFSVPEVRDLRDGTTSFAGMAEYSSWGVTLQGSEGAESIAVGLVTGNYFDVMGLAPVLGRVTGPADDGPGVPPVMVLTYDGWITRFGGDPDIVGRQLQVEDASVTVIGVLQPAPFFPTRVDALLNMVISPHHLSASMVEGRTHRMTEVVARLEPDATVEQARGEVVAVAARLRQAYPDAYDAGAHQRMSVIPFKRVMGERAQLTLWLLMSAAAFVLIIAAANVANLTLMRGVRRDQELVVRAALGAGATRLRRLLLAENLVLTLIGAALGAAVAIGGVGLLKSFAERYSTRANEIRLDLPVLGFAVALAVALALVLSFLATLPKEGTYASRIAAGMRRMSGSLRKQRLQRALVVVQIAVSVVLLAGATLLTRTMIQLSQVETGLRTEEILTVEVGIRPTQLLRDPSSDAQTKERYYRMRDAIAALPGVTAVAIGTPGPLRSSTVRFEVKAEAKALAVGEAIPRAEMRLANPEFFRASGIPLVAGREFTSTDQRGSARVVIVNQALADRLFPGTDPIGQRVAWTGDLMRFTPFSTDWRTVVGVVRNTQDGGLDAEPRAAMYMPFAQELTVAGSLVIRADSNVAALIPAVTRIVRRLAPTAPIDEVMTIAQIKDQSVSPRRLNAALVSSFGLLAVIIAAVGIAGVLAFSVSARTNEIGIRMSLGADSSRVQRMILGEGGLLLAVGLVLGVVGAYFGARVIRGLLFGVAPHDPVTLVVVPVMMAVIGVVACWIPALRASRIDPAISMRVT
ncbi:MAG TPA: ABC transporter permease [Gemmatimonadaceae bacterium]|nr:ABC transporter permease [Gemmatimonadaceae bacterium]